MSRGDDVLYSLTRRDVEEFAGRELTDDEAERFRETFPLTTVDQCVYGWLEGLEWHRGALR